MPRQLESHGSPRNRFDRSPTGGLVLTERDEDLLSDLYLHRAMSRGQIEELHFGSVQRCNARLRQLFDHGYLLRYFPPAAPYGAQAVYSIAAAAVPVVARRQNMEETLVRELTRKSPTPTFREHTLAIVDFRLALMRDVRNTPDLELVQWLPEMLCRHEYEIRENGHGRWRTEVFKPDGFFRLKRAGGTRSYFLEIDLGHTSARQFAAKLDGYNRYMESGLYSETFGDERFSVLVVTCGTRRANHLALAQNMKPPSSYSIITNSDVNSFVAGVNT